MTTFSLVRRLLLIALLLSAAAQSRAWAQSAIDRPKAKLALAGHCTVCLHEMKQWVKGDLRHSIVYDGREYRFPSAKELKMFQERPDKYVPVLHGDDVVEFAERNRRVPGNLNHGLRHQGRIYLFADARNKEVFQKAQARYADVDLALGGDCAVCLAEMGKAAPGKTQFTAHYDGLRYQFPSEKERALFQKDPARYVAAAARMASKDPGKASPVTVEGTTACAGCQYGVGPLGAPDEMGLAIDSADGKVYIVEDAHRSYAQLYQDRFDGLPVRLTGSVIKQDGKFRWVKPARLELVRK
jgi:YHS domain-containing protein